MKKGKQLKMQQLTLFVLEEVEMEQESVLTNEEKIRLIREGKYDLDLFLAENKKLVFAVQNKLLSGRQVAYHEMDDFESLGMYALYKAVRDFDETKGFKFSTVAYKYIMTELQMHYHRRVHKHNYQTRYHLAIDALEVDMIESRVDALDRHHYNTDGLGLNERQQAIYDAYLETPSFTEVAKQFGISKQCICDSVQRTQAKMRKKYYAY